MSNKENDIEIVEHYSDYIPPFPIKELIEDLLSGVSKQHLHGLQSVILNSSSGLNRKSRRQKTLSRKRKVAVADCQGVYNQKWHDGPATIQLFVDNIIVDKSSFLFKILFFRRMIFADVLFHELGHHIHYTKAPEYKEREDVAEEWRKRLKKEYTNKRYRYLKPLKPLLNLVTFFLGLLIKAVDYFTKLKRK